MKVVRKDIDMLCWFDKKGYPNPVRFRFVEDSGECVVVKIDKVITREFEKLAGNKMFVFTCQCIIRDSIRTLVIKYELDSCTYRQAG